MDKCIQNKAVLVGEGTIPLITWVPTTEGTCYERLKMHDRFWMLDKFYKCGTALYKEFDPNGQTNKAS